ncbi:MAG: hypothetical protein KKG76_10015 [Euryarchaeota archaeon]|nr:hypothetical protein [Euryarchaeota archaeon]MBU4139838.1 hypothetical protein [Euryarchaeota archaeon]
MDLTALINTLDIYSGTITAFATIFLVIVTGLLVLATLQLANITKNQDKPWLYFYWKNDDDGVNLYVKNVGKGVAVDVQYRIGAHKRTIDAISPKEKKLLSKIPVDDKEEFQIDDLTYKDINLMPMNQNRTVNPKIILEY